jgi:hypothetical protein
MKVTQCVWANQGNIINLRQLSVAWMLNVITESFLGQVEVFRWTCLNQRDVLNFQQIKLSPGLNLVMNTFFRQIKAFW